MLLRRPAALFAPASAFAGRTPDAGSRPGLRPAPRRLAGSLAASALALSLAACAGTLPGRAAANPLPERTDAPMLAYADLADLVTSAPLIIDAVVHRARPVEPERSQGLRPGHVRLYLQADITALIAGRAALQPRVALLADLPLTPDGKAPKLKGQRLLLFAAPVADDVSAVRLVAPDAALLHSPARDAAIRAIATDAIVPDAPPAVRALERGYHAAGPLPGDSETQIFVATATGVPLALSIRRAAGNPTPVFGATFGELAVADAGLPAPGTLAHYRLACGLPPYPAAPLPGAEDAAGAAAIAADYAALVRALGPCGRQRTAQVGA